MSFQLQVLFAVQASPQVLYSLLAKEFRKKRDSETETRNQKQKQMETFCLIIHSSCTISHLDILHIAV